MAVLLRDHAGVRAKLQERFQYILIDEYQDTNHAQFILAHMLAMNHKNICATGDPDQSIYGWRGANIKNIMEFEQFYPNAKVVLLEQNYRSTKTILKAASGLIANNTKRKKKDLWTENEEGPKIVVVKCNDEHQEAAEVVRPAYAGARVTLTVNDLSAPLRGERVLLRDALVNLLQNALDFSPAGSGVEFSAMVENCRVVFSVEDHGPGVPDYALPRVFERFYSLPPTGPAGAPGRRFGCRSADFRPISSSLHTGFT